MAVHVLGGRADEPKCFEALFLPLISASSDSPSRALSLLKQVIRNPSGERSKLPRSVCCVLMKVGVSEPLRWPAWLTDEEDVSRLLKESSLAAFLQVSCSTPATPDLSHSTANGAPTHLNVLPWRRAGPAAGFQNHPSSDRSEAAGQ